MDDLKNTKWIALDDKDNIITGGNDKNEIIKDIELFNLLKIEYGVRLIRYDLNRYRENPTIL